VLEQRKRIVIAEAELVQEGEVRAARGKFVWCRSPRGA